MTIMAIAAIKRAHRPISRHGMSSQMAQKVAKQAGYVASTVGPPKRATAQNKTGLHFRSHALRGLAEPPPAAEIRDRRRWAVRRA